VRPGPAPLPSPAGAGDLFAHILLLIGLAVIGTGSAALVWNARDLRRQHDKKTVAVLTATSAIGLVLAAGSFFVMHSYGENARIVGFPFPAAVWEKHGDHWEDFVGPLMLPFMCGNAWFAFVLPHLILRVLRRRPANRPLPQTVAPQ
jgi:hypothetical protein